MTRANPGLTRFARVLHFTGAMSQRAILIDDYMTASPFTIGREQTLATAKQLMRQHRTRHLPVLHGGRLVGLLSQRDVHLVEALPDVDPEKITVEEAMTEEPYAVAPGTPLAEVARVMAEHKYGAAVVMRGNEVTGVFTTVDALRALSDALSR